MQDSNIVSIAIRLINYKFVSFTTTPAADNAKQQIDVNLYEYRTDINFSVDRMLKQIDLRVKVTVDNIETKEALAYITSEFSFYIENFDEAVINIQDEKIIILPGAFMTTAGIAISTTRGMFAMVVATSSISNAIFPLMDASKFVPDPNMAINPL